MEHRVDMKRGLDPDPEALLAVERATFEAIRCQVMLERARMIADSYQDARDAAIRAAAAAGAERTSLARAIGLGRRTLYTVLDAPRGDDEARLEWLQAKSEEAETAWAAGGMEGSVDDYWPL